MSQSIDNIRQKGTNISDQEAEAAVAAILLHDIGHGPFSHALEQSIISGLTHEDLSVMLMNNLNAEFNGKLDLALAIFNNTYPKRFLHQLVSGQLDMDRMDYLMRDSFYAGVAEGTIGTERIIKMLNVAEDQLVVEAKGIYSIEKFLIARRLMYWQVYFHKTVIAAENLLLQLLRRAKAIASTGKSLYATSSLSYFLKNSIRSEDIEGYGSEILENFIRLDDDDIMVSAKSWSEHEDPLLSLLSRNLIRRILPRVRISDEPFDESRMNELRRSAAQKLHLSENESNYMVFTGLIANKAYSDQTDTIKIIYNTGEMKDLSEASDIFHLQNLMETKKKYFLCYPKDLGFNY
jgi:hypothetical protein